VEVVEVELVTLPANEAMTIRLKSQFAFIAEKKAILSINTKRNRMVKLLGRLS